MNYLGLDLSLTATGFYLIRDGKEHLFREIRTKPADFPHAIARVDHIADEIIGLLGGIDVDMIAMEDYFSGRQPNSVIQLAILGTVVRCRLLDRGYSFLAVAPTQIKKFETGSGVAPKDTMVKSVFKTHGFDTDSNNIADACAIAYLGRAYRLTMDGKDIGLLKYQEEVLKKIRKEREMVFPYRQVKEKE